MAAGQPFTMSPHPISSLTRGAARVALVLGLSSIAASCNDAAGPQPLPVESPAWDLLFDGHAGAGESQSVLVRASGDGRIVAPIAGGHLGTQPRPAPDGRTIVYQPYGDGSGERVSLRAIVEGSTEPAPFGGETGGSEREVSWSPDGRRVALTSDAADALGDIWVADVDGHRLVTPRNLTAAPGAEVPDRTPAWSPDGEWIAFSSARGGSGSSIWVMRADGREARRLTIEGDHDDYLPAWSPDGRQVAFQRNDAGGSHVGLVTVADGAERIVPWPAPAQAPAWRPDGAALAISSLVDHEYDIWVVATDGTALVHVRRSGPDRHPAWIARERGPR